LPYDLFLGVDPERNAEAITRQGSEIGDLPISPKRCMERFIVWCVRGTDCFSQVIEPECDRGTPAQRSQVGKSSVVPGKRVLIDISGKT